MGREPTGSRARWLGAGLAAATLWAANAPAGAQTPFAPLPQGSPIPRLLPSDQPAVAPGAAVPAAASAADEVPDRPVRVSRVTVSGVTTYPAAEVARMAAGLIGEATPLPRIDRARQAILLRYRADGYALTTVSARLEADGALHFNVVEGYIARVKLDGDIGPAGTQVLRFLQRLTERQPLDQATLERYLLLAQDVPGVSLHAVLQSSPDAPGALTLVAQVSRKAVSGLQTVDNRAFRLTGPIESLSVLDFNSFTEFGEKTEVSFYHSFPNSQNFGQASSELFVGASGLRLRIFGGAGVATPTGGFATIGYDDTTTVFGASAIYPVIRARQQTLNVALTFDGLQSEITTDVPTRNARQSFDSLRTLRLAGDYTLADLWLGDDLGATDVVSLRLSHGLHTLGAATGGADAPRLGERTDFAKLDGRISRTQTLLHPYGTATIALMALLAGQFSDDVLPPAEQFYLGGSDLTRGYYAGQVTGDKALAATLELQLNTSFDFAAFGQLLDVSSQFYAFYDWGETWQNLRVDPNTRLRSAGIGARMLVTPHTEFDLEALERFNRYPGGASPDIAALGATAVYWRVLARF